MTDEKKPSRWWYALPIIFGLVGGFLVYVVFRNKNREFAMASLIVGLASFSIYMFLFLATPSDTQNVSRADYDALYSTYIETNKTLTERVVYNGRLAEENYVLYTDMGEAYDILDEHKGDLMDQPTFCLKMRLFLPKYISHLKQYNEFLLTTQTGDPITDEKNTEAVKINKDRIITTEALLKEYEKC